MGEELIMQLYAIKDKVDGYNTPVPFLSVDLAKRWFKTQIMTNSMLYVNADDYELYRIGEFNKDTGKIIDTENTFIVRGSEYANSGKD